MARVLLRKVNKIYGARVHAVKDLDLEVRDGEFVSLLGPSGCGKSSTLRMIAGLEEITSGELYIGDKLVNNIRTEDRDISMVFEYYALFPHMTVYDNVAFPLKVLGYSKEEIKKKVDEVAEIFGIRDILYNYAFSLSGGQKQQVGMARALVKKTPVLLMDEPISHLDMKLRLAARTELARLQRVTGITTIYVTHDQSEALALSDRIAVMNFGVLQQFGTPNEIFSYPDNKFVASFIGEYPINFLDGEFLSEGEKLKVGMNSDKIEVPNYLLSRVKQGQWKKITIGIRPEDIKFYPDSVPNSVPTELELVERSPEYSIIFVKYNNQRIIIQHTGDFPFNIESCKVVYLNLINKDTKIFDKDSGKTILSKPQT